MLKVISMVMVCLLGSSAWAVDVSLCPSSISFNAQVTKVYASSIYKDVPGWKDAQKNLSEAGGVETVFALKKTSNDACFYTDDFGNGAKLSSFTFRDPEMETEPTDQLSVSLLIENSKYVTFIPVKFYTVRGVELYATPFSLKIKTSLYIQKTKKTAAIDLGMISVSLK